MPPVPSSATKQSHRYSDIRHDAEKPPHLPPMRPDIPADGQEPSVQPYRRHDSASQQPSRQSTVSDDGSDGQELVVLVVPVPRPRNPAGDRAYRRKPPAPPPPDWQEPGAEERHTQSGNDIQFYH